MPFKQKTKPSLIIGVLICSVYQYFI
jgi:hypothetical protein